MEIVLPVRDVFEYCREPPGVVRAIDVGRQTRSVPHDDANITVDDNGTLVEDHGRLPTSHVPPRVDWAVVASNVAGPGRDQGPDRRANVSFVAESDRGG